MDASNGIAPALEFAARDAAGRAFLSPTDIAQFIRLDQCGRYLRLRLHERANNRDFLSDFGVSATAIPPLLTHSGATFEEETEAAIRAAYVTYDFSALPRSRRADDNAGVLAHIRALPPGETLALFQPRVAADLAGWQMRGDLDILRLERAGDGTLSVLIADIKSSATAKVEHRLQVAFYAEMLAALLAQAGIAHGEIALGILYRGGVATPDADAPDAATEAAQRAAARRLFGADARLEIVPDADAYRNAVRDLVTGPDSVAAQVAAQEFAAVPYHLTYKCDGCLYNEFCLRWSAEYDDLSLLPHLTAQEKAALQRGGIETTTTLAALKELRHDAAADAGVREGAEQPAVLPELVPRPETAAQCAALAVTWPVGPRLDEVIHRARRYRKARGDAVDALSYIPNKGYGSLPYCDAAQNPNLIRIYLDAQHDYLHDRIYMVGALVVACENGVESPERRRSVVAITEGPPETPEREEALLIEWIAGTLRAVAEIAAPDADGALAAPIHLIFYDRYDQHLLLTALARHFTGILGATPLYDFMTQIAAFDSPVATFLRAEIRELKNYPILCQSLHAVAAYLGFDWGAYRQQFRARLFDSQGRRGAGTGEAAYYTRRARFSSQIPLEYAYAAWGDLDAPQPGRADLFAPYRAATVADLRGFHARRLAAMERIAQDFRGNWRTRKQSFDLSALASFAQTAHTLADALDEFVTIERHAALGAWKTARHAPPERRLLSGITLLARYHEADQSPETAAWNRENVTRHALHEGYVAAFHAANPGAKVHLTPEQRQQTQWSQAGMAIRLRLECAEAGCSLDEALGLTTLRAGDRVVVYPRVTTDSRLPEAERTGFTPTARQLLYGPRADLAALRITRDAAGKATAGYVEVTMQPGRGGDWSRGFAFGSIEQPFHDGMRYTLDADPNDFYGYWCKKVTEELRAGAPNAVYARLQGGAPPAAWPEAAAEGQARFLAGLDAFAAPGPDGRPLLHGFEASKREFIGDHGGDPTLLVQGPPGTGKSYSTAFAVFARVQGAMAAGIPLRAVVSCKTHAATDVLLGELIGVREELRRLRAAAPDCFARHFDARLLDLPLARVRPRGEVPDGAIALRRKEDGGERRIMDALTDAQWSVTAATPGGVYQAIKERWPSGRLHGHALCDCLVLDEASQMNLPEACLAGLLLKPDGRVIVVGDPRQMPPIVQHDWDAEQRRTFRAFRAYESLFRALQARGLSPIRFQESFRLHREMAAFLRREVYAQDGIAYHSRRDAVLPAFDHPDPFVAGVLNPAYPLVVVVHHEGRSQLRNPFEEQLITPILAALADPATYRLDAAEGLGVVVPHRAQRAALREHLPCLSVTDPATGAVVISAVDTVERFQGGEREAILVSATESDRDYLLVSSEFLLDPRRLTVALSRARRKMVLVAAHSVFSLFSADEETFMHAQLWKNLLRRTCTVPLWAGERDGIPVTVWGNAAGG